MLFDLFKAFDPIGNSLKSDLSFPKRLNFSYASATCSKLSSIESTMMHAKIADGGGEEGGITSITSPWYAQWGGGKVYTFNFDQ